MNVRRWFSHAWLILVGLFMLQWLVLFSIKQPTWDAVSYYIYARSVVFDRDLDFENDYQLSFPTAGEHFASKRLDQVTTATGRVANLFAVGAASIWLPWLAVLKALEPVFFPGQTMTGYENYYVTSLATLSALWGLLAFWIALRLAQGIVDKPMALAATITLFFTSPLLYYQFREPMYAHATSALVVALCVYVWSKQHDRLVATHKALLLGGLIGLAGLVRWQNLSYLLLPLTSIIILLWKLPGHKRRESFAPAIFYILWVIVAAVAVFLLQMSVWKVIYGSFITIPQGSAFFDLRAPFLDSLLLSSFRGVLTWMPIFLFAFAGLIVLSGRKQQLGIPLLVMLIAALYINGSTRDWFAGGGYGPRRLSGTLAILVVGYAAFLDWLPARIRRQSAVILGVLLALHQWVLLRFGLPERIGGRVISMEPSYSWEEVPLLVFLTEILKKLPEAFRRPLDFFVLTDSPLDLILRQNVWPAQHLMSLAIGVVFLLLILTAGYILSKRSGTVVYMILLAVLVFGLLNLWILAGSG
ncbi:MAG: hypothetical protein R3293_01060 [Candidatus Promineifilaceae bacterium]|nr:hypothetical protein [Candidatus Promineifilaceae bacterium]